MRAILLNVAGPSPVSNIACNDVEPISFGRDSSNSVVLAGNEVSRNHCVIKSSPAGMVIRDLGSHNGTKVNGEIVEERILKNGDQITIGLTVFVFIDPDAARVEQPGAIEFTNEDNVTVSARLSEPGGHSPKAERLLARTVRDLDLLCRVATKIGEIRDADSLQSQLVWALFETLPVDRCAVVFLGGTAEEIRSVAAWDRNDPLETVRVSRTVLRRVFDTGEAFLARDIASEALLRNTTSAERPGLRSILCVPMLDSHKVIGAIYAESDNPKVVLDDGHVQLLSAIGSMAGLQFRNAIRAAALENENTRLLAKLGFDSGLVGRSKALRNVIDTINKVAPSESTVLITGETGTGKELVARALHQASSRAGKPFVAVNCAAITETLLESELFGHEKGAFTGADSLKRGFFEQANTGTIFLDEVGELAPAAQAKLLRVLQQREVVRVGGTQAIRIDVRMVAATNRDLRAMVKDGRFRDDLYYRLHVVTIAVPPLRDRMEDVADLAQHFAQKYARACKRTLRSVSPEALECMTRYSWPGNIRELENAIERAVVLGTGDAILPEDLPETLFETGATADKSTPNFHAAVAEHKRTLILDAVRKANGNLSEAARLLGLHPNYLHRLVTNMDLRSKLPEG